MRSRNILGGITVLLFMGVFYIFAFSMVGSVEDMSVPTEYYGASLPESAETDTLEAETAETDIPKQETTSKNEKPKKTQKTEKETDSDEYTPGEADGEEHIEAVPAMVTVTEAPEKDSDNGAYDEDDDNDLDYPEDFDVDDYDSDSDDAEEQQGHARDNDDEFVFSEDEDDFVYEEEQDNVPVWTDAAWLGKTEEPASPNIVITLNNTVEQPPEEVKVSVNAEAAGSANVNANETFTAKFNGAVQTVNAYDLICWIVNNEISPSFNDEAIKAQAVAAYSYVKYHNVNGLTPTVLVKKNPPQRIKDMVSSVWGVCCYYNGSVAQTVYMASSSGYTADAKNVWGGSVPYLKSVHCPLDAQYDPNYGSTMTVSESNMRSLLEGNLGITLSDNPYNWLVVTGYVDGNYVSEINVDGQKTISGRKMRENILSYKLKSAAFDVSYSDGTFTFTTYGYGHGVGMSQNGANILAKQGYTYTQILKFYFTGIEVL